ncbi:MAG: hypothetical protein ACRDRA_08390 [Pseudonocardiaceae bacterium]
MTIWLVAAIPVLIMFFALAMERLEHRLRHLAVRENLVVPENEVDGFLQTARPEDALFNSRLGGALAPLRLRRLRRPAMVHSRHVSQRS